MGDRAMAAITAGAVLGAIIGYMFFTERGRAMRRQIEPALDDMARELSHFRATVQKAAGVANEGWKLINETLGDASTQSSRYANPHQTSPF